jgi:hypothetical protein
VLCLWLEGSPTFLQAAAAAAMQQHQRRFYISVLPGRVLVMRVRLEGVVNLPAVGSSNAAAAAATRSPLTTSRLGVFGCDVDICELQQEN